MRMIRLRQVRLDPMYKVADRVVFLFEGKVIFFGPAPWPHTAFN